MRPIPNPSIPMLLLMVWRPFTPFRTSAAIRFSGIPQMPKPPIMTVAPSKTAATASSELATTLFTRASPHSLVFCSFTRPSAGAHCDAHLRLRVPTQCIGDHPTGFSELLQIDAGFNAHAVQHIDKILSSQIAGGAGGIRTTTQTGNGTVNDGNSKLQAGQDIGQGLTVGVMKMDREIRNWHALCHGLDQTLRLARGSDADRIAERNFVAAEI